MITASQVLISLCWHRCGRGGLWDSTALLTNGGGVIAYGTRTRLPVFSSRDLILSGLPRDSHSGPSDFLKAILTQGTVYYMAPGSCSVWWGEKVAEAVCGRGVVAGGTYGDRAVLQGKGMP